MGYSAPVSRSDPPCARCGNPLDELDLLLAPTGTAVADVCCAACLDADPGFAVGWFGPNGRMGQPVSTVHGGPVAVIGVRELRNQVAAVLRRAAAGERIIVSVDGRPMAQLGPLSAPGPPTLADLAAAGLVEPPRTGRPAGAPTPEDLAVDVRLDRVIEELRGR